MRAKQPAIVSLLKNHHRFPYRPEDTPVPVQFTSTLQTFARTYNRKSCHHKFTSSQPLRFSQISHAYHVIMARPLHFCPVVSPSFFFFLFSSPNLSRRRLDVCHTTTHGVALVRI